MKSSDSERVLHSRRRPAAPDKFFPIKLSHADRRMLGRALILGVVLGLFVNLFMISRKFGELDRTVSIAQTANNDIRERFTALEKRFEETDERLNSLYDELDRRDAEKVTKSGQ